MEVVRTLTHDQLSVLFHQIKDDNAFDWYFTNHRDYRILVNSQNGKAIVQEVIGENGKYVVTTYYALHFTDLSEIKALAERHGAEGKTSIMNSIMASVA